MQTTRKPLLAVAKLLSCDLLLLHGPIELDLNSVRINHQAIKKSRAYAASHLVQNFVLVYKHTHADNSTWTTKAVGGKLINVKRRAQQTDREASTHGM